MNSSPHARVKDLFLRACALPEEERRGFLDAECPEDNELRREVEDLLRFYEPPAEHQPQIGGYRLIRSLGEGGMGEVWQAEQEEPVRRPVAVKLIKAGMDSRQVVARFPDEPLLVSGWIRGEDKLHRKAALVEVGLGQGRIVLFGFRPQFRAQTVATFKLLFNAIHLGGSRPPETP